MPLKDFPDYIDYLPHGCIARKIGVMGYLPELDESRTQPIAMSREEFASFSDNTASLVVRKLKSQSAECQIGDLKSCWLRSKTSGVLKR